jgi:hypothetical protein
MQPAECAGISNGTHRSEDHIPMHSRLLGTALIAVVASLFIPTPAQAVGVTGSAFVTLDDPDASMCVVPGDHNWNSTSDFTPVNEVCSDDVGLYSVYLPGLGATAGTVQVTAYGSDGAYCKTGSWGPDGTRQRVKVRCFSAAGTPADSRFTLSYTNRTGTSVKPLVYVFSSQPTAASYTPPANYQHNSVGGLTTITRPSVGTYTINVPNAAGPAGNVQVTAYGAGTESCTAWNWADSGTALRIQVRCWSTTGVAADSKFTMTYARDTNLLGRSVCCNSDGHPTAYLFAHNGTAASYVPASQFGTDNAPITHPSTGRYVVDYGGVAQQGVAHVSTVGYGVNRCKIESWASETSVNVLCTDLTGAPANATYQFHHVGPFVIG